MVRMQHAASPKPSDGPAGSATATADAPAATEPPLPVDVAEIEIVVARIANIPARQASSSDKDRLRTLGRGPGTRRVRPGRSRGAGDERDQALARGPRHARSAGRLLPVHRPDGRRQDRARAPARDSPGQRVHAVRHERVHGEARGGASDWRAAGLRGLRAGRPAGGCGAPASIQRGAARRN